MCLTIPKRVISAKNGEVIVKSTKGKQRLGTIVPVKRDNWVLTQNNVIIKKISLKQAQEINQLLKETKL